jgi:hypothetical protein
VNWAEYWNGETTIYVNARHKRVHYEAVVRDLLCHLPSRHARVVDYGCGDMVAAHRLAGACGHLYLCDSAPRVRDKLIERYADQPNITVVSPQEFEALGPRTMDLIVVNSVVQYLSAAEFLRLLGIWREKLGRAGRLVLADVIPRRVGSHHDALELLKFGAANGFLLSAVAGLVRSYFSNYRQIRKSAGFLQFDEQEMLNTLEKFGFAAHRHYPNIGHNTRRMTFVAARSAASRLDQHGRQCADSAHSGAM